MAETNSRPYAQDIRDEQPINFIKAEDIENVKNGMKLRLPPVVEYLNNLPMCRLSNLDKDSRTCAICREDFETDGYTPSAISHDGRKLEIPLRLSCNHVFGDTCASHWLNRNENCPYCNRILFEKLPSIDTEAGLECRLGFLELCAIHKKLKPEDEETRDFIWARLERLRAYRNYQEQRESETYGEPETERELSAESIGHLGAEEDVGWYRYQNQRIYLPDVEATEETSGEDAQAHEGSEDILN